MSSISDLISILSTQESKSFENFLREKNKRHDTKNIRLFRSLLNGNISKLKGELSPNAFAALKKRLKDNLINFISTTMLSTEASQETEVIKKLLLSRKLLLFGYYSSGLKLLEQTEKSAIAIQHFSLLNEIYHTFIQYSFYYSGRAQEELFELSEINLKRLLESERRNMTNAKLKSAFRNYNGKYSGTTSKVELSHFIESERENINEYLQFEDLLKITEAIDVQGDFKKNYASINLFFIPQLERLVGTERDNEQQLPYLIDLLYLIANINFRKKRFKESISYLDRMEQQMIRYNEKFYAVKKVQFITLKALNLNFIGEFDMASTLLDRLMDEHNSTINDLLNPLLCRTMIHFQQNELIACKKLFSEFQQSDEFYERKMGLEWLLNKKYMEILLHIELGNLDLVDSRIRSLKRKHGAYFRIHEEFQVMPFLNLILQYLKDPGIVLKESFVDTVEKSIDWKEKEEEDIFFMCFYAWLKAKMKKKPLYETTLDLVQTEEPTN